MSPAGRGETTMAYNIGDTATPFTLPPAEGGEFTVEASASTATVVVSTSHHCPYALAWHERLQELASPTPTSCRPPSPWRSAGRAAIR
jgi:hypothetical protein